VSTVIFHDRLKFSEVKPLHKDGDPLDFSNYRPISLLTSFSKVIEKIIHKRLYHFLDQQKLIVNEQHGFRQKASTETAAFFLLNTILLSLDKKSLAVVLFLDLRKAFDCVDHAILLYKLNYYGISGKANELMKSYITDRYQRVVLDDKFSNKLVSEWKCIKHGVPQGSVLGPLLFLIYINDLPRTIDNYANSVLFADDTSIIITNTDPQEFKQTIDISIQETNDWFLSNLLTVNYNKTQFLQFFAKKKIPIQIITSNSILNNINTTKFLGLTLDSMLSWREHITALTLKLNKSCFAFRAIKPFMTTRVLKMVYYSYFHSIMSYGIIFWGSSHFSINILRTQKRIIRIMTNRSKRDSCRQLYKQLQILTLPGQYILSLLLFVIKYREFFPLNSDIHDRNTRYNDNLHPPTTNLTPVQKGVLCSGIKIFNCLPTSIKSLSKDPKHFKNKLKNFLLEHTLYSLNEYYQVTSK